MSKDDIQHNNGKFKQSNILEQHFRMIFSQLRIIQRRIYTHLRKSPAFLWYAFIINISQLKIKNKTIGS